VFGRRHHEGCRDHSHHRRVLRFVRRLYPRTRPDKEVNGHDQNINADPFHLDSHHDSNGSQDSGRRLGVQSARHSGGVVHGGKSLCPPSLKIKRGAAHEL
jgi:hypothetical protein